MRIVLLVLAGAALGASVAHADDDAVKLEERAFAAIEGEKWCLAMRLFEAAQEKGPAVGLLQNAAQAGELGGDFGSALGFLLAIKNEKSATKADRATASKRAADLAKKIASKGPGALCPTLLELEPPVVAAAPPPSTPSTPAAASTPSTSSTPVAPPPVERNRLGFIGAGVGGGAVVLGVATAAVGLVPWFDHAGAVADIEAAEENKADARALQERQARAREAWEGYGQALTVAGSAAASLGVAVVAAGLGYALLAPSAPSEAPLESP